MQAASSLPASPSKNFLRQMCKHTRLQHCTQGEQRDRLSSVRAAIGLSNSKTHQDAALAANCTRVPLPAPALGPPELQEAHCKIPSPPAPGGYGGSMCEAPRFVCTLFPCVHLPFSPSSQQPHDISRLGSLQAVTKPTSYIVQANCVFSKQYSSSPRCADR